MAKNKRDRQSDAAIVPPTTEAENIVNSEPNDQNADTDQPTDTTPDTADLPADFDLTARPIVDILVASTCPEKLRDQYTEAERTAMREAFTAGTLKRETRVVRVSAKTAGSDVDELWPFYAYIPTTFDTVMLMSNSIMRPRPTLTPAELKAMSPAEREVNRTWGAIDYWAYGYYLQFTQPIRLMLMENSGGEEKVIQKLIKHQMKSGLFETEEEAREVVVMQRAKKAARAAAELAASQAVAE